MILGRSSELKYLNTFFDRDEDELIVVYGEKNVGKTALLSEFTKDKEYAYYKAASADEREQLYLWGRQLQDKSLNKYPTFGDIFRSMMQNATDKKVIVIDEFQHILKTSEHFVEDLIAFLHDDARTMPVMVILLSSSVGFVENSMVNRLGHAAYELSGLLKIKELDFEVMMDYFPGFDMEKCIEAYAVLGGKPGLWRQFNDKKSLKANICDAILSRGTYLYEEAEHMVKEELRETNVYNTILASLAEGMHKLNDLHLHTGFSRAKISVYIKNLMELELVEKVFSYDTEGKANTQKGIYRISNHFVHFYFTFIYPNLSFLESIDSVAFYEEFIGPYFKSYVEKYFKTVCTQRMEHWNRIGKLPFEVERFGEWVGKFGNIDIIAQSEEGKTIIGLCNFEKPIMPYEDYEWLLFCAEKAKLRADYVYLFSVGRFDEKITLEAKMKPELKLITMDDM